MLANRVFVGTAPAIAIITVSIFVPSICCHFAAKIWVYLLTKTTEKQNALSSQLPRKVGPSHNACTAAPCGSRALPMLNAAVEKEQVLASARTNPWKITKVSLSWIINRSSFVTLSHTEVCACSNGGRCICAHKKQQPRLDMAAESESDKGLNNSTQFISDSLPTRDDYTLASPSFLTLDRLGHDDNTWQNNELVGLDREQAQGFTSSPVDGLADILAHAIGGDPRGGSFAVHESCENQNLAMPEPAACGMHRSNISSAYQQLSMPLPLLGRSNIGYLASINPELSSELLGIAPDMSSAELSTISWKPDELSALSSNSRDQIFNDTDLAWFTQPNLASTTASTSREALQASESATAPRELRSSAVPLLDEAFDDDLNPAIGFSEAEHLGGQPNGTYNQENFN